MKYVAKYMQNTESVLYRVFLPAGRSFQLTRQQASEIQIYCLLPFLFLSQAERGTGFDVGWLCV